MVKNSMVKKNSIYKWVIYYFPSRWKIKYLIVFSQKFLFQKCFLKFLTKISVKKPSDILFPIKIENKIFNSLSTEIFVSPCIYKLIVYIYIYLVILRQLIIKNARFGMGLEPSPHMYACMRCGALTDRATHETKQHTKLVFHTRAHPSILTPN